VPLEHAVGVLNKSQGEGMKFMKYVLVIALAVCAMPSNSKAQTLQFLGGGSSALFLELGQASQAIPGVSCIWSFGKNANIVARDNRFSPVIDEQGNIWIAWGKGTGTCAAPTGSYDVYSYEQLDSVVGDKCYFEVDSSGTPGCVQVLTISSGTAGANKISGFTDTPIPANVISAINGQHYFVAGTDIRPEDAKFAIIRMLTPCNQLIPRQPFNQDSYFTTGLGYQGSNANLGTTVQGYSGTGGGTFNVANFNIVGNDPVSGSAVPTYGVSTVGAQPILVAVAPFPTSGNTGIAAASDIPGFSLALFYQGVIARSTDLQGPTTTNPVNVLVREPLSGTYNTFEFSVPNGTQYHASQDYGNCNSSGAVFQNPLNYQSANAQVSAFRQRVIGTGNMVAALQAATTDTMGYFFWSAANAGSSANIKYLKVNGVDPLLPIGQYNGVLPGTGHAGDPGLGAITFDGINSGDYPIWSPLRLVSRATTPGGVSAMLTALGTLDSTQHDYITLANLKVWHSHFYINNIGLGTQESNGATINPATPNDLCNPPGSPVGTAEIGGDVGGSNVLKVSNANFCADYGVAIGLVNKTQ
jgi:ABC-type phosphate transport system substrate-binding protein